MQTAIHLSIRMGQRLLILGILFSLFLGACDRAAPLTETISEDVPRFVIRSEPGELLENGSIKAPQDISFSYSHENPSLSGSIERVRWTLLRLGINQVVQDEPVAASSDAQLSFRFSTASKYELLFEGFSNNGKSGSVRKQFTITSDLLPTF